ncbi:hypothetical protein [Planomonospora alba]
MPYIEERVGAVEHDITEIKGDVAAVRTGQAGVELKLDRLAGDAAEPKGGQAEIRECSPGSLPARRVSSRSGATTPWASGRPGDGGPEGGVGGGVRAPVRPSACGARRVSGGDLPVHRSPRP